MGIFDSLFGSNIGEQASDAAWGGSQSVNYAVNTSHDLLNQALLNAQNYLADTKSTGKGELTDAFNQARGYLQDYQKSYLDPYATAGQNALNVYGSLLGLPGYTTTFSPENYLRKTPGYLWQLGQGQKALDASAASRGMLLSGPQRQASQTFGQNQASTYYDKLMSQLGGLTNTGLTASTAGIPLVRDIGSYANQLGINQANLGTGIDKYLAELEYQNALNRSGLQFKGAQGTVNAYNQDLQGQVAQNAADQGAFGNILGLAGTLGGLVTSPLTGGTSLLGMAANAIGGGGGGGGGYSSYNLPTSSWNNAYSNWLSGR